MSSFQAHHLHLQPSPQTQKKGTCIADSVAKMLEVDPRFAKLNFFQGQLRKIMRREPKSSIFSEKTTITKKSKHTPLFCKTSQKANSTLTATPMIKIKRNMVRKPSNQTQCSTVRHSHKVLLSKKTSSPLLQSKNMSIFTLNSTPKTPQTPIKICKPVKTSYKLIKSSRNTPLVSPRQSEPLPAEREQKKDTKQTKIVKFSVSESSSDCGLSISNFIQSIQERITQHIFDENFEAAMDEIKNAEDHLEQLQEQDKQRALDFTLKISNCCRQAGKQRYGTLLLKRVLLRYQRSEHRILLLRDLGQHYEQLKEYKSAIEVNLQLVRLGQTECLDKVGEMHVLRQNFSEALKYYERYHEVRNDTYSLVKLAHAYSKIPSYSKRAIDLLNDLLFVNKTCCTFRQHSATQTDYFHSALLLLATIYMNLNGHKKAADICEKYLKEDYSAYPIFYILGVLRVREQRQEQAFSCFLNAVRLKPNYLPSLLELLRFLTSRSSQVLAVLRKAFHAHHRDWELLRMLVEAATKSPCKHPKLSIAALIECANGLEGTNLSDLQQQIEAIWMWAAELIEDRQRRISVVGHQFLQRVYVRLGEIALKKGDYLLSERYSLKVLQKLQLERGRLRSRPPPHYAKLEIQILRRMAYIKSQRGEAEGALSYLQQSKQLAGQNEMVMEAFCDSQKIGQLHFVMESYNMAIQEFNFCSKILEVQGVDCHWEKWKDLQLEIGNCHQNMHQWREARKVYQGILSHRLCEPAIRTLANIYAWQGSPQLAKELLQSLRVLRTPSTLSD